MKPSAIHAQVDLECFCPFFSPFRLPEIGTYGVFTPIVKLSIIAVLPSAESGRTNMVR
jgi:hypothetical protein